MTQAEHPVQSPDVTTSVNSSAHCGFSGGIGPPYSAPGPHVVGYRAPVPEILEVERYRVLAEKALGPPDRRVWMVDSRYGRGGTTPQRLRAALVGRSFTAARRAGQAHAARHRRRARPWACASA